MKKVILAAIFLAAVTAGAGALKSTEHTVRSGISSTDLKIEAATK